MLDPQSLPAREARFIEPMECLAVFELPEGAEWVYEIWLSSRRDQLERQSESVLAQPQVVQQAISVRR